MKLYEINTEMKRILDQEEIDVDEFEKLNMAFDDKMDNTLKYRNELKGDEQILDTEIKRLTELKKHTENKRIRLEYYIDYVLREQGIRKANYGNFRISYRASERVIIDDKKISDDYKKVEYKVDKAMIKDLLKSGKLVEGAYLEERSNLQIK